MPTEIYCPQRKWKPDASSLWQCLPVCGHAWNTFDTRGVCPSCGEVFEHTQCPRCQIFSLHKDWYHEKAPPEGEHEEEEQLREIGQS